MNENEPTQGRPRQPSARRSIHGNWERTIADENMVKYSCRDDEDDGADEVDNVQSKYVIPRTSPLAMKKRRNSHDNSLQSLPNHSLSYAKSAPTIFPSYSYYSDYDELLNDSEDMSGIIHESYTSTSRERSRFNTSNDSDESPNVSESHNKYRRRSRVREQETNNSGYKVILWFVAIALVIAIVAIYYPKVSKHSDSSEKSIFYNNLSVIGGKYKINEDVIISLKTGISSILEREDTHSFVFIYNSSNRDFDEDLFYSFMDDVALSAAKYLRNKDHSVRHIVVDSSTLDMQNHKELLNKYSGDVTKTGVLLVKELDKVPSTLAMAFHYYCDEYNPLVKTSAILFTLNLAECKFDTGKSTTHADIEKCLKTKWDGGVPKNNIHPLLTRVVNTVIDVTKAF